MERFKTVLVTGGSNGIGKATVKAFLEKGFHVSIFDKLQSQSLEISEAITKGLCEYFEVDITSEDDLVASFANLTNRFEISIAINNAGILGPMKKSWDYSLEDFQKVMDLNLTSLWMCCREEIKHMLSNTQGRIINIGSASSKVGITQYAAYAASKHAVDGLTKSLALELSSTEIRVNSVAPGFVNAGLAFEAVKSDPRKVDYMSKQNPMKRLVAADEVARTILWLSTEAPSSFCGESLVIDCGYTVR